MLLALHTLTRLLSQVSDAGWHDAAIDSICRDNRNACARLLTAPFDFVQGKPSLLVRRQELP